MINYSRLGKSSFYYKKNGFLPIEVPWTVPYEIIKITLPQNKSAHILENGTCLVGSAEQSFLYLVNTKNIKGKFQAITPCFRDDKEDELHQPYFMKNELFRNDDVSKSSLEEMMQISFLMFSQFLKVKKKKISENEYDIIDHKYGIELGSYGIRSSKYYGTWVYGTGLAEPRLSIVINKYDSKNKF